MAKELGEARTYSLTRITELKAQVDSLLEKFGRVERVTKQLLSWFVVSSEDRVGKFEAIKANTVIYAESFGDEWEYVKELL